MMMYDALKWAEQRRLVRDVYVCVACGLGENCAVCQLEAAQQQECGGVMRNSRGRARGRYEVTVGV